MGAKSLQAQLTIMAWNVKIHIIILKFYKIYKTTMSLTKKSRNDKLSTSLERSRRCCKSDHVAESEHILIGNKGTKVA